MRVKMLPWNAIWMECQLTYTGSGGVAINMGSLPANIGSSSYYPNAVKRFPLTWDSGYLAGSGSYSGLPRIYMGTSGAVQVIIPNFTASVTTDLIASFIYANN